MVLVFDLDDTLYEEMSYVKSGLREVAGWLFKEYHIAAQGAYEFMLNELIKSGRGHVFDQILRTHGIYSKTRLKKCISVYRLHIPQIVLKAEAYECLLRLGKYNKYIVTDGHKIVQYNKIKALRLDKMPLFKKIFITYRHGHKNGKPSPYCFMKICKLEHSSPRQVLYIGDNPHKDFVGIKPLGFKAVRLMQGNYKDLELDESHEAHIRIHSLNELTEELLNSLFYAE